MKSKSKFTRRNASSEEGVTNLKLKHNISGELTIGKLVTVLIFVLIAMALIPAYIASTNSGSNSTTYSNSSWGSVPSSAHTLIPLLAVLFVIGIIVVVAVWLYKDIRETG